MSHIQDQNSSCSNWWDLVSLSVAEWGVTAVTNGFNLWAMLTRRRIRCGCSRSHRKDAEYYFNDCWQAAAAASWEQLVVVSVTGCSKNTMMSSTLSFFGAWLKRHMRNCTALHYDESRNHNWSQQQYFNQLLKNWHTHTRSSCNQYYIWRRQRCHSFGDVKCCRYY